MIIKQVLIAALVFVVVVFLNLTTPASFAAPKGPTAPANLRVTAVTETTMSLAWNPSTHNRSFSYRVSMTNHTNSQYNTLITVAQTQTAHTVRFLPPNSGYSIKVFAVDAQGARSADSNIVSTRTLADITPPTTPTLETLVLGPSQIRLTWSQSTDNIHLNCCEFSFVMNDAPLTQHINWAGAPQGFHAVVIRHLTPATSYSFKVNVRDYQGNIATSNMSSATTESTTDTEPPTAPTNLHIVGSWNCEEFFLGWTESTDNSDPQELIEYEIYVNGVLSGLPVSAGVDNDFVYAHNCSPTDVFTVKAVDRAGNTSAASNPVSP